MSPLAQPFNMGQGFFLAPTWTVSFCKRFILIKTQMVDNTINKRVIFLMQNLLATGWLASILFITSCDPKTHSASTSYVATKGAPEDESVSKETNQYQVVLFCGNDGEIVSSLCNDLFQRKVFSKLTQDRQEHIIDNVKYVGVIGIKDDQWRRQAARQLEIALKEDVLYKIIFVVGVSPNGDISIDDLVTINLVGESINQPFHYGILLYQATKTELDATRLKLLKICPSWIATFYSHQPSGKIFSYLCDQSQGIQPSCSSKDLTEIVAQCLAKSIAPTAIKPIMVSKYRDAYEEAMKQIDKSKRANQNEMIYFLNQI